MKPTHSIDKDLYCRKPFASSDYDEQMPDVGGLAIWHIIRNPAIYGTVSPPPE